MRTSQEYLNLVRNYERCAESGEEPGADQVRSFSSMSTRKELVLVGSNVRRREGRIVGEGDVRSESPAWLSVCPVLVCPWSQTGRSRHWS